MKKSFHVWKVRFLALIFPVVFFGFSPSALADLEYDWTRTWGDEATEHINSVATDSSGNAYVTGHFSGTVDFDPGPTEDIRTSGWGWDIFLSKYDTAGAYQWTRAFGADGWDDGFSVAVDQSGNVYVAGSFELTVDFDPGTGTDVKTSSGESDVFLSKYSAAGNYQWTATFGGSGFDEAQALTVEDSGNVYVTGYFNGTVDFDPSVGLENHASAGASDTFLSAFDGSGGYRWAKTWGGSENDVAHAATVDKNGNVYVAGFFSASVDFNPGPGEDTRIAEGSDMFLSKYGSTGGYQWAKTFGPSEVSAIAEPYSLTTDEFNNLYVAGRFSGTIDFDSGTGEDSRTALASWDIFLSKYDAAGSYQWTRAFGGDQWDEVRSVATDSTGNVFVSGSFSGTVDFDPSTGEDIRSAGAYWDAFLSKYSGSGEYLWTKSFGGIGNNWSLSMDSDPAGNVYVAGSFLDSVGFDPRGGDTRTSSGMEDAFVSKYGFVVMNGSCGSSHRSTFEVAPTGGLCNVGLQSSVTGNGPWSWTCSGVNGGTDEACSANYESGNEGGGINPTYFFNRFNTQLDINATISLSCDPSVTMNALVGTGRSAINENNRADCTVITNNSAGYALSWQASTDDLLNSQSDHFAAYSPASSTTPETWDIPNTVSAWGAKLASTSEGYNGGNGGSGYTYPGTGWGSDDSYASGLWLNVAASEPFQFMQKATETDASGETQSLMFAAEIGADKLQPTGAYSTNVTVTAVTLSGGSGGGEVVEGVDGNGCSWFSMAYGETKNRTLDSGDCQTNPANDYAEYAKFTATAGDFIRVVLDYENDYNYLVLTDDNNTVIRSNWGFSEDSVINYTIPTSGTYRLWAASYYPSLPVSYTLTLDDTESYAQNNGYGIKITVPVFGSASAVDYRIPQPGRWLTIFEVPYGNFTPSFPRETIVRGTSIDHTYSEALYSPPAFPVSVHSVTVDGTDVINGAVWGNFFHQNIAWYHTKVHFVWDDPTKNVDVFVFTDAVEQPTNTLVTSPSIPVTGVAGSYPVSISGNGSPQIEINGSDNWITGGTINVGDRIRVRLTSSSSVGTTNTAQIVIGDMTGTWNVTSAPSGFALNPFSFSDQTNVSLGLTVDSSSGYLSGFSGPQTAVCGSGCVEIARNGVWSGSTMVGGFMPGDNIAIRQVASSNYSTTTTATVTVGPTTSATWSVTTLQDTTPDGFSFNDLTGQSISTLVTSDPITISGFSGTLTASIAGNGTPRIEINNSGTWVSSASITPGQSVRARLTTPAAGLASTLITVGNTSDVWTVATTVNCTNIGDVCWDGTIRAGVTPDGSVTMYATRCDAGQTWTGAACTGSPSTLQWASASSTTGFTSLITGENNTSGLSALGAGFAAARYCDQLNQDGNNDWYLPARDELAVLRTNRAAIGNFSGSGSVYYWSSTELSSTNASGRIFSTGTLTISAKTTSGNSRIRCVRK